MTPRMALYSLAVILTPLGCCIEGTTVHKSDELSLSSSVIIRTEVDHLYTAREWVAQSQLNRPQPDDTTWRIDSVLRLQVTVLGPSDDAAFAIAEWWSGTLNAATTATAKDASKCAVYKSSALSLAFLPDMTWHPLRPRTIPIPGGGGERAVAEVAVYLGLGCAIDAFDHLELHPTPPVVPIERGSRSANRSAPLDLPPFETWKFESNSPMVKIIAPSASK